MQYLHLLRRPAPFLLWFGQLTSALGDRLYAMTVMWMVYETTGSTRLMSAVSLFESVPLVLTGLVGGALIDRWDRIRSMVWVDLVRGGLVLLLPGLYLAGRMAPWHLMAVGLGLGSLNAFFSPALQSIIPSVAAPGELQGLMGLMDSSNRLSRLLGPGCVALLLTVVHKAHLITFDGISFIVSGLSLWVVSRLTHSSMPRSLPRGPVSADLKAAWLTVTADRPLVLALCLRGVGNLVWASFTLGAPLLASQRFHGDIAAYGWILAAYGGGNLLGNVLAGNLGVVRRLPFGISACINWLVIGLGFIGLGLASTLFWALAATAFMGLAAPVANVTVDTHVARSVPETQVGKVYAVQRMMVNGAGSIGMVCFGWAMTSIRPGAAMVGSGLWTVLSALLALYLLQGQEPGEC